MDATEYGNTLDSINQYAKDCIDDMKKMLSHTDNLKDSITYEVDQDGDGFILSFIMPDYAVFVNDGRRAGAKAPPIKAIKDWALNKGLKQFRDARGRYISNDSRAFLIARSIGRKGIKPIPFMDIPNDNISDLMKTLGAGFAKDIADNMQMVFDEAGIGD